MLGKTLDDMLGRKIDELILINKNDKPAKIKDLSEMGYTVDHTELTYADSNNIILICYKNM